MSIARLTIPADSKETDAQSIARRVGECVALTLFNGSSEPIMRDIRSAGLTVTGKTYSNALEVWSEPKDGRKSWVPLGDVYLKANGNSLEVEVDIPVSMARKYDPKVLKALFHYYARCHLRH